MRFLEKRPSGSVGGIITDEDPYDMIMIKDNHIDFTGGH